jgi:hypothetical protein
LDIRQKVAKHLVTLVIRTRLLSSNWTLQLSAQEPPQLNTPAPYIRHMDNKVRTRSLSNWTLPGRPQPKLRLTLVICTRVPKHRPTRYITPPRTPSCPHKFPQASGHSGCPHRIGIEQLGIPVVRTRVPKQLDIPIVLGVTMVPGLWTMDDSIKTSVS